jgi:hypothetical protein
MIEKKFHSIFQLNSNLKIILIKIIKINFKLNKNIFTNHLNTLVLPFIDPFLPIINLNNRIQIFHIPLFNVHIVLRKLVNIVIKIFRIQKIHK